MLVRARLSAKQLVKKREIIRHNLSSLITCKLSSNNSILLHTGRTLSVDGSHQIIQSYATQNKSDGSKDKSGSISFALALLTFAALMTTSTSCETLKKGELEQEKVATAKLEEIFSGKLLHGQNQSYFSRPDCENIIAQHLSDDPPNSIMAITGAKCVGKSAVLEHALAQNVELDNNKKVPRKGVIIVNLNKTDVLNIEKKIVKAFGADPEKIYNCRDFVIRVCNRFYEEHQYYPVIVLRTTSDMGGTHALTITSSLSQFSRTAHCAVTIVDLLTNRTAISMLQEWRAFCVTVPELTREQVAAYLGNETISRLAEQGVALHQIMATVGGNLLLLDELSNTSDAPRFLRRLVDEASVDLQAYLTRYPTHRSALQALSARQYSQGLPLTEYNAAATPPAKLRIVDLAEASSESLQYNLGDQTVVFASRAHHAAAVELRKT